jgi:hypothetical protein
MENAASALQLTKGWMSADRFKRKTGGGVNLPGNQNRIRDISNGVDPPKKKPFINSLDNMPLRRLATF